MKLVTNIEVAYFRSIYKDQLSECRPMNIAFGRNDSGKSNVLRALNLFFNNQTNPGQPFRFERDFNHSRRADADDGNIKKFVYVKIEFQTPPSWRASLGDSFWVKKQWSVTNQDTPQVSSPFEGRQQQYLTRFLNKVRFYYIPAIKDRKIFEQLQSQIYERIAAHEDFSESLRGFAGALRERTADLTQGLLNGLGINSAVSTPQDLTDLFRSLDFETTSEAGDSYSLTLQRGDGIQVRHIPLILSFLSERDTGHYFLWGFEEPENSLELANAIQEAETFQQFSREPNIQVFLTSHSPAFFTLESEQVQRYFVSRSYSRKERLNSVVKMLRQEDGSAPGELMGEAPHLAVVSSYLKEADAKIRQMGQATADLQQQLQAMERSILFVEGEADKIILDATWRLLIGGACPFDILPAGGTTKMESLGCDGRILSSIAPTRKILVLVDNDAEGRRVYKNGRLDAGGRWIENNSSGVWWRRLPLSVEFRDQMTALRVPQHEWPGCMENLFPVALREEAVVDGELRLTDEPHAELLSSQIFRSIKTHIRPRPDLAHHYVLAADPDFKIRFARWLEAAAARNPQLLSELQPILQEAARIVNTPVRN
ncbi:hypothetical protein ED208_15385 [Stagnimonas aquatica]|uniref:ATPase AAA-type core domain-containing protein n=1 Tax=Stagnimonas aquatica TaxID=2689987 RepID=A0A3N0V0Y6_9GAMM|nr:AAA family ATPase [Stagnimonas aquatica]ROH86420.1 hypothetical protein ED208_15385 [Stagnimonas aquatica]